MDLSIKPSDLQYRYPKNKVERDKPKFSGKPDKEPFDRDDLYEVIPMFEAVMNALDSDDARVLHRMEEILCSEMPGFIRLREEVFDFLVGSLEPCLRERP